MRSEESLSKVAARALRYVTGRHWASLHDQGRGATVEGNSEALVSHLVAIRTTAHTALVPPHPIASF